jgi:hypothetical protein
MNVLERVSEFLAYKLAGGPVFIAVPEPSTVTLGITGALALLIMHQRRRSSARRG